MTDWGNVGALVMLGLVLIGLGGVGVAAWLGGQFNRREYKNTSQKIEEANRKG